MEQLHRILLVQDDVSLSHAVKQHLDREGFNTECTPDATIGLERSLTGEYSLVLLDLGVAALGNLEVCRRIRAAKSKILVFMLSDRDGEMDKVVGLELGADDYLTKPFSVYELTARIRGHLRRLSAHRSGALPHDTTDAQGAVRFGPLEIDILRRRVLVGNRIVELTVKEFDVLSFFVRHPGRPFTREELLEAVWNASSMGYADTVGAVILRLRRKIERNPSSPELILTVRGIGYRFVDMFDLHPGRALLHAELGAS